MLSKTYELVVIGGGFPGMYAAWRAAELGMDVLLLESSSRLGGVLNPIRWKNFTVDQGTHNIDLRRSATRRFFEDLYREEMLKKSSFDFASVNNSNWTYGIEQPDFSFDLEFSSAIERDLLSIQRGAPDQTESVSLVGHYQGKYGASITRHYRNLLEAKFGVQSVDGISSDSSRVLSFLERPKVFSDQKSVELKCLSSFWDERIGCTRSVADIYFKDDSKDGYFGYPKYMADRDFNALALAMLKRHGVEIRLDEKVVGLDFASLCPVVQTADNAFCASRILWTLPHNLLVNLAGEASQKQNKPQIIGARLDVFEVPLKSIRGPDYVVDYDLSRRAYRYNNQGLYSDQITDDGSTFIVAESYFDASSPDASAISKEGIWSDAQAIGFIESGSRYVDTIDFNIGVGMALAQVSPYEYIQEEGIGDSRVISLPSKFRGRDAFVGYFEKVLLPILSGP